MHALYSVYTAGVRGGVNFVGHAARRTELFVECHGKMRQWNADFTEQCKQAGLRECCHGALKSPPSPYRTPTQHLLLCWLTKRAQFYSVTMLSFGRPENPACIISAHAQRPSLERTLYLFLKNTRTRFRARSQPCISAHAHTQGERHIKRLTPALCHGMALQGFRPLRLQSVRLSHQTPLSSSSSALLQYGLSMSLLSALQRYQVKNVSSVDIRHEGTAACSSVSEAASSGQVNTAALPSPAGCINLRPSKGFLETAFSTISKACIAPALFSLL